MVESLAEDTFMLDLTTIYLMLVSYEKQLWEVWEWHLCSAWKSEERRYFWMVENLVENRLDHM